MAYLESSFFSFSRYKPLATWLSDGFDFDLGVVLAVAPYGVNPFFGLISDGCDFVGLFVGTDNFGSDFGSTYFWGTDSSFIAVQYQQWHKSDSLVRSV